jgi:hypothetical protein
MMIPSDWNHFDLPVTASPEPPARRNLVPFARRQHGRKVNLAGAQFRHEAGTGGNPDGRMVARRATATAARVCRTRPRPPRRFDARWTPA